MYSSYTYCLWSTWRVACDSVLLFSIDLSVVIRCKMVHFSYKNYQKSLAYFNIITLLKKILRLHGKRPWRMKQHFGEMQLVSKLCYNTARRTAVSRCSLRRPVGDTGHFVKIDTESLVLICKYLSSCFCRQVSCFPGSPFLCQPFYQYGTRLLAKYIHLYVS